jgi:hypothetical protein
VPVVLASIAPRMPDPLTPPQVYQTLNGNIERVIQGQDLALRKLLAAFASGGSNRMHCRQSPLAEETQKELA